MGLSPHWLGPSTHPSANFDVLDVIISHEFRNGERLCSESFFPRSHHPLCRPQIPQYDRHLNYKMPANNQSCTSLHILCQPVLAALNGVWWLRLLSCQTQSVLQDLFFGRNVCVFIYFLVFLYFCYNFFKFQLAL